MCFENFGQQLEIMIYVSFYVFQIFNLFSLRCKMCDNILDQYNFRNPDSVFVIYLTFAHRLIKNSVLINEHIRLFAGQCKSLLIGEVVNNIFLLICFRCPKSTAMIECINLGNLHSPHILQAISCVTRVLYQVYLCLVLCKLVPPACEILH